MHQNESSKKMKIKELTLFSNKIQQLKAFYTHTFGLKLLVENKKMIEFQIGNSILRFLDSKKALPYHFALTIPSNKELEALLWLKQKVEVIPFNGSEIIDFPNWNAKSLYFYDSDKNIVEFIARKNLNLNLEATFDSEQLIEISEIGIATTAIEPIYRSLNKKANLEIFYGNLDRFCAIGSENGLFICINKNLKPTWFPTDSKTFSSDFTARIENKNTGYTIEFKDDKLSIKPI